MPPASGHFHLCELRHYGNRLEFTLTFTRKGHPLAWFPLFWITVHVTWLLDGSVSVEGKRTETTYLSQWNAPVERSVGSIWIPGNWDNSEHISMISWQHGTIYEHFDKHFTPGECVGGPMNIFMLQINVWVLGLLPPPTPLPFRHAMRKGGEIYRFVYMYLYMFLYVYKYIYEYIINMHVNAHTLPHKYKYIVVLRKKVKEEKKTLTSWNRSFEINLWNGEFWTQPACRAALPTRHLCRFALVCFC